MGVEIERKFLLRDGSWRKDAEPGIHYMQGYMRFSKGVLRARVAGEKAFLTLKGAVKNASRLEFEYPIPREDAEAILRSLAEGPFIEKTRYIVRHHSFIWEIDEFAGDNSGLTVAEIELEDERQGFPRPSWLGEEVTSDMRYSNSNLAANPFSKWSVE